MGRNKISYIFPKGGYWDIPGVKYRGETGTWRLFEKLTRPSWQYDLLDLFRLNYQRGKPHPMDVPLHFAIFEALYNLRKTSPKKVDKAKEFLITEFRKFHPHTLTNIVFYPDGGEIIHNKYAAIAAPHEVASYQTSLKFDKKCVLNSSAYVNWLDEGILTHLFGVGDSQRVNRVIEWIAEGSVTHGIRSHISIGSGDLSHGKFYSDVQKKKGRDRVVQFHSSGCSIDINYEDTEPFSRQCTDRPAFLVSRVS